MGDVYPVMLGITSLLSSAYSDTAKAGRWLAEVQQLSSEHHHAT